MGNICIQQASQYFDINACSFRMLTGDETVTGKISQLKSINSFQVVKTRKMHLPLILPGLSSIALG